MKTTILLLLFVALCVSSTEAKGRRPSEAAPECPAGSQPFDESLNHYPARLHDDVAIGQNQTYCLSLPRETRWIRIDVSPRGNSCSQVLRSVPDTTQITGGSLIGHTLAGGSLSLFVWPKEGELIPPGAYLVTIAGGIGSTCDNGVSSYVIRWSAAPRGGGRAHDPLAPGRERDGL